ncbi:hypothetical protein [Aestuariimicrobium kwangyangense]|uniref:hypothetical protein n=1 Tax=Aestuariimicrobium kwangyangense TaxID=396389 RepID=UPI0003B74F2A|nr:hypothetical protein [Aestuariimicrobium kwangyangense]
MPDLSFSLPELDQHVQSLDGLAAQVRTTVSQAQTQPSPLMYGLMMGPVLVPVMTGVTAAAGRYLNGAAQAIETTSQSMRQTARRYRETEQKNVDAARRILD